MAIAKPPREQDLAEAKYRKEHRAEIQAKIRLELAERRKKRLGLIQ